MKKSAQSVATLTLTSQNRQLEAYLTGLCADHQFNRIKHQLMEFPHIGVTGINPVLPSRVGRGKFGGSISSSTKRHLSIMSPFFGILLSHHSRITSSL